MSTLERIFQAVMFELIALAIIVPSTVVIAGMEAGKMGVVGIGLSLFAMVWNYVYNIGFDKLTGDKRSTRSLMVRIIHACGFELSMIVITLPILAWYLSISWLEVFMLEAGFLVFILIYTYIFNLLYDKYQPYRKWFKPSVCA